MQRVLLEPQALPQDTPFYWNYTLTDAGIDAPLFQREKLTFGLVLLPPMMAGSEFVKTHGHYHACMPGSQAAYPEVYTHYYGEMYLLLQRRRDESPSHLDDLVLFSMQPGQSITIPPGYAHILINPSDRPALMAGLYTPLSGHIYEPIREMAGAALYLVRQNGRESLIPNQHYTDCPPLRRLNFTTLAGTPFTPPDPGQPLWASFVSDPSRYAFITSAEAAHRYFLFEDLRL
jgi:glucose-6-phosphate isomerase